MPSQAKTVELWDKLEGVSGALKKAVISDWSQLVETNREDGNDTCVLSFPISTPIWSSMTEDWIVRIVGEDATLRDYPIYIIEDDAVKGICTVTCAGARAYLGTATQAMADQTIAGNTVTTMAGAISPVGTLSITVGACAAISLGDITTSNDTFLSYLNKIVSAVNAGLASGVAPCVMKFTPTISSGAVTGYVISIITTVATGTAHLLANTNNGKNIAQLVRRRNKTDPTFPLTGYTVTVADVYRNNPSGYPYDKLSVYETCRLEYIPLSIDTVIRIVAITTDHSDSIKVTVELGTPERRVSKTVADITTAVSPIVTPSASPGWVNADIAVGAGIQLDKLDATTASRALASDASGFIVPATTTAAELDYVAGVTSSIQTQIDAISGPAGLITSFRASSTGSGYITLDWKLGFTPSGAYFKLFLRAFDVTHNTANGYWYAYTGNNITGASLGFNFVFSTDAPSSSEGFASRTECSFGFASASDEIWFRLELYDGSNVLQSSKESGTGYFYN